MNAIFGYCIAEAAARFGVLIHEIQVMSNHVHFVVTYPNANLPEFLARAHTHIAKCMNALFGWTENFWSPAKTNVVVLKDRSAVIRKLVYARVNPVAQGLVSKASNWPGLHTASMPFGSTRTFKRPRCFFRENGPMPETATLKLVKPPALADLSDEEATALVRQAVREEEAAIRQRVRAEGGSFLGAARCKRIPRTTAPGPEEPGSRLSPTFATLDREQYKAALERRRAFLAEYRSAYLRWKAGDRDVEFPPGTYALRVHAGVRCRGPT